MYNEKKDIVIVVSFMTYKMNNLNGILKKYNKNKIQVPHGRAQIMYLYNILPPQT